MFLDYSALNLNRKQKSGKLPKWKLVVSWVMIFMVTDVYKLVPSPTFASLCFNIVLLAGWFAFLLYIIKYGINKSCMWIIGYCVVFPIYGSLKAEYLFGQTFLWGIASLRYLSLILCGYILILMRYPYSKMIAQINTFNVWIAGLSIILILILNVPVNLLDNLFISTNAVELNAAVSEGYHAVRGVRFTKCSEIIYVSLIYYLLDIVRKGFNKKNTTRFILLLVYMLFVHKGRQPIAVLGIVYVIAYIKMRGVSMVKMLLTVIPVCIICLIMVVFPQVFQSFAIILDGENSADFSTLARILSVESVIPYIEDNPILGMGNLSTHFKDGFHAVFGNSFYIADIGIFGTMARGGIVLVFIYAGLYLSLIGNASKINDKINKRFLNYMILVQLCLLLLFFHDTLNGAGSLRFALIFYPLFSRYKIIRRFGICNKSI